jgi:hypothetical protein
MHHVQSTELGEGSAASLSAARPHLMPDPKLWSARICWSVHISHCRGRDSWEGGGMGGKVIMLEYTGEPSLGLRLGLGLG